MAISTGAKACAMFVAVSIPGAAMAAVLDVGVAANIMGVGLALGFGSWLAHVMLTSPMVPQ